ncbi:HigA family addiction module antitoxin [Martelella sp. AD-3]|uniref:HigA family addiction module antitoxin n=1 Tax=Martelella sp. AD-3 TaxID=686597 RepID=UPI0004650D56|nr:HigA family addiction module antitoxin [Martelella sp. AD-3]AMM84813.1 addiction module antitoxin [Martelella sp. AD-3]
MDSKLPAVHPGEILREEYLVPFEIDPSQLASTLKVPSEDIDLLIKEATPISAELALKLAKYFRTSPEFWMHMQASYDLKTQAAAMKAELDKIPEIEAA